MEIKIKTAEKTVASVKEQLAEAQQQREQFRVCSVCGGAYLAAQADTCNGLCFFSFLQP